MRLEQLHYFKTLIQEGSFTKAAERLHISQPSLTASIKAMEKELDIPLLIRDTRSFTLTEEGKQVLAFAKETLASYQTLLHSIKPEQNQPEGTMRIAASKFFCELILERFICILRDQFPKIKVHLIENEYRAIPQNLSASSFKFVVITRILAEQEELCGPGLLVSDEEFYDSQYHYLPLFTDTFGFCVAKSSLLASLPSVYPTSIDFTQHQKTTFPWGSNLLTENTSLSSNNPQLHIEAMLKENAFCRIPYFVYQHYFGQEEALTYRAYSNNMTITYYLIYPTEHTLSEAEQVFINELQQYLTQMKFK